MMRLHGAVNLATVLLLCSCIFTSGCAGTREQVDEQSTLPATPTAPHQGGMPAREAAGPAPVLLQFRSAVQRRDLPQVREVFCASFRNTVAEWERQVGQDAVLDMLSQRLSFPECPGAYSLLVTQARTGAVWVTDYERWEDAWREFTVAKQDNSTSDAAIRYCGLDWRLESGSWRLKYW